MLPEILWNDGPRYIMLIILRMALISAFLSTRKSTLKRERHQKEAPIWKPLVINLGKAKIRFKVNVVPRDEISRAPDGNVIEEVQNLDDSTNETDQDWH